MRWRIDESDEWRPWFAWYPVRVARLVIWLEWIERYDYNGQWGRETAFRMSTQAEAP